MKVDGVYVEAIICPYDKRVRCVDLVRDCKNCVVAKADVNFKKWNNAWVA